MIPLKIGSMKLKFMDSRLLSAVDKARYGFLIHAGGLVRKISRNSQKPATKKKDVSRPGDPPVYHKGSRIRYKDTIEYHVDKTLGRMICGAYLFSSAGIHKPPKSLEYGGPATDWITTYSHITGQPARQKVTTTIKARPHQRPALEKFVKQYQDKMLKNMVKPL